MAHAASTAAIHRRTWLRAALVLLAIVLAIVLAYVGLGGAPLLRLARGQPEPRALQPFARPDVEGCASPGQEPLAVGLYRCRFLVTHDAAAFTREWEDAIRKEQAWWRNTGHAGPLPPASLLAISGGGDGGAFGAGLLVGWSEAGNRPEFKIVTGISTGALSAPLAFLGRKYDGELEAMYTKISQRDVFTPRGILSAITADALSDTTPLYRLLERHIDRPMLDAIAAEYAKGRLLFIGTCDLDSLDPVVWNMTAIAASKDPRALVLFRKMQRQAIGDLYRIYALAGRDHIGFNLAYIPPTFTVPHTKQFDTHYMLALFETGRVMGRAGYPWQKSPPGYAEPPPASEATR